MPLIFYLTMPSHAKDGFSGHLHKNIKNSLILYCYFQVFFIFAIFVFREIRFFRNLGSFAKLQNSRNSSLIFAKYENRFVASFAKFSRNEISSKTLLVCPPCEPILHMCVPPILLETEGTILTILPVRYHSGGSMKLNACILILAHMVYL